MSPDWPEISDVIVAFDEQSLARLPVSKTALSAFASWVTGPRPESLRAFQTKAAWKSLT